MGRPPKTNPLIPLAPPGFSGKLTKQQQNCAAWCVLSNCRHVEAFTAFMRPELVTTPGIAQKYAAEFFANADVIKFMDAYTKMVVGLLNPSASSSNTRLPKRSKEKNPGETDEEYKTRCKREAAESVVDKIIDRVDDVEDIEGLLDTIKAMEKTGFFDSDLQSDKPPMRYLPETCSSCEYKRFIDEQIKLGNVVSD